MLGALCFGAVFGLPFIIWGAILILDRERSWQRRQRRATSPQRRGKAWDRRQIAYGCLLIALGIALFAALAAANYMLQAVSPPAPM